MSLSKQTSVDQITVSENGVVSYRTVTSVFEDGGFLNKSYHRTTLAPGQDLTGEPAKVQAVCSAIWTPGVITAYQEALTTSMPSA